MPPGVMETQARRSCGQRSMEVSVLIPHLSDRVSPEREKGAPKSGEGIIFRGNYLS